MGKNYPHFRPKSLFQGRLPDCRFYKYIQYIDSIYTYKHKFGGNNEHFSFRLRDCKGCLFGLTRLTFYEDDQEILKIIHVKLKLIVTLIPLLPNCSVLNIQSLKRIFYDLHNKRIPRSKVGGGGQWWRLWSILRYYYWIHHIKLIITLDEINYRK
jgi:hypothetical protein